MSTSLPHAMFVGLALLAAAAVAPTGCASSSARGPYTPLDERARDPNRAGQLNSEAAKVLASDPHRAERLLREALNHDLYHGPAHNNLGVVYLKQNKLYEAAGEFEWARKLMPGDPDPRVNLAMTLEQAGRVEDALAAYDTALEVGPHHVAAMQGLARLQLRTNQPDERTAGLLEQISMRGETEQWRQWARESLALHRGTPTR